MILIHLLNYLNQNEILFLCNNFLYNYEFNLITYPVKPLYILKIGGSVATFKDRVGMSVRTELLKKAAHAIRDAQKNKDGSRSRVPDFVFAQRPQRGLLFRG